MAGEFVGPPTSLAKPVDYQYAPGVVVTPAGAQALAPAPIAQPGIFNTLKNLPKPVLIGGAILLAYFVLSMRRGRR
jgi:hypothetical protein